MAGNLSAWRIPNYYRTFWADDLKIVINAPFPPPKDINNVFLTSKTPNFLFAITRDITARVFSISSLPSVPSSLCVLFLSSFLHCQNFVTHQIIHSAFLF